MDLNPSYYYNFIKACAAPIQSPPQFKFPDLMTCQCTRDSPCKEQDCDFFLAI